MTQKYLAFEWYSVNHKLLTKTIFYLNELNILNYLAILLPFILLYGIWPAVFWVSNSFTSCNIFKTIKDPYWITVVQKS